MEQLQIPYFLGTVESTNYVDAQEYPYSERQEYYKFLGILPTAGHKQIRAAILAAYKRYHPDTGASAAQEFQILLDVKEFLTDPELKRVYDRTGFPKPDLITAIGFITKDSVDCTLQGAEKFEDIRLVLQESYRSKVAAANEEIVKLKGSINKLQAMLDDIVPSTISNMLISNFEKEIRGVKQEIIQKETQRHNADCLLWLLGIIYGKRKSVIHNIVPSDIPIFSIFDDNSRLAQANDDDDWDDDDEVLEIVE